MYIEKIQVIDNQVDVESLKELPEGSNLLDALVIEVKDLMEFSDQTDEVCKRLVGIALYNDKELSKLKDEIKQNKIFQYVLLACVVLLMVLITFN